jgi:hypothetical protein
MIPQGKTKILGGKPVGYNFIHHRSPIGLVLNPDVRGKSPANNRMSNGTALKNFSKRKV